MKHWSVKLLAVVFGLDIIIQMVQFYCLQDSFQTFTLMILPILGYSIALYMLPVFVRFPKIGRAVVSLFLSIPLCFVGSVIGLMIVLRNGGINRWEFCGLLRSWTRKLLIINIGCLFSFLDHCTPSDGVGGLTSPVWWQSPTIWFRCRDHPVDRARNFWSGHPNRAML